MEYYLKNDNTLIEKHIKAEEAYIDKLGDDYSTIQIDLVLDEIIIEEFFVFWLKRNMF